MRWQDLTTAQPELTAAVEARFLAHRHHVLATLGPNGRPRQWGTEVGFHDGDLWIGSMPGSAKGADLDNDARCSLHAAPIDLAMADGDAIVEGLARPLGITDSASWITSALGEGAPSEGRVFIIEIERCRHVTVDGDALVTRGWTSTSGLYERRRH